MRSCRSPDDQGRRKSRAEAPCLIMKTYLPQHVGNRNEEKQGAYCQERVWLAQDAALASLLLHNGRQHPRLTSSTSGWSQVVSCSPNASYSSMSEYRAQTSASEGVWMYTGCQSCCVAVCRKLCRRCKRHRYHGDRQAKNPAATNRLRPLLRARQQSGQW